MTKSSVPNNGLKLRAMIAAAKLTQRQALDLLNEGQLRPISLGHWKAYLSPNTDSARRCECPDSVLTRAAELFGQAKTASRKKA